MVNVFNCMLKKIIKYKVIDSERLLDTIQKKMIEEEILFTKKNDILFFRTLSQDPNVPANKVAIFHRIQISGEIEYLQNQNLLIVKMNFTKQFVLLSLGFFLPALLVFMMHNYYSVILFYFISVFLTYNVIYSLGVKKIEKIINKSLYECRIPSQKVK